MGKALIFTLFFFTIAWSYGSSYTMADLESLVKEGSHQEFFIHALDIRPSERQESWKSMVSQMGDAYTRSVLSKTSIDKKDFTKIEDLYGWPSLKSDEVFKIRRQQVGIRYLDNCLKLETPCWEAVKKFWESDKTDNELGFQMAQLVSNYKSSPIPIWNFLEVAVKGGASEFYCKKEFVLNLLWKKFSSDYATITAESDFLHKIDQTVHPGCISSLNNEAVRKLLTPSEAFDREVAYTFLKAQGKMSERLTDFFYTVYLLEKPSQGEFFNYAWNRVKELGSSASRREEVLNLFKKLDPLPDELLTSVDDAKKRAIFTHFKRYFPEYLDYYTNQCLSFYEGKGSFPKGNPTIHCQDLMNSDLAPKLIDDFKIKKFQEIRKI